MSEHSGWQLSGSAPEAYERYIVQAFMGDWTRDLVEAAAVQAGERVLDVACGTGVVTRLAAQRAGAVGQVVGLDMNAPMLAVAQAALQQEGGSSIAWREGDVAAVPFPDASFAVVLCQQGLQFFADKPRALREMCRVLVPGGRLALSVWRSVEYSPWQRAVADALARHVSAEAAAGIRGAFVLGDAEELRALIAGAGFRKVHLRIESKMIRHASLAEFVPGYLAATPVGRAIAALDAHIHAAILRDISASLQSYTDDDGLAAPIESHVVVAYK